MICYCYCPSFIYGTVLARKRIESSTVDRADYASRTETRSFGSVQFTHRLATATHRSYYRGLPLQAFLPRWDVSIDGGGGVRVSESAKSPTKRIIAEVKVHASVEEVWQVLTDYEKLAEFVPNLESCERVPCATPGRVWLKQKGCSQSALWRLEACALLEVREVQLAMQCRELRFKLVEGDFMEYSGRWVVEPDPTLSEEVGASSLRYEVNVVPKMSIPSTIVSHVVRSGLPNNLLAIANRAEQIADRRRQAPGFIARCLKEESTTLPPVDAPAAAASADQDVEADELPAKGPARLRPARLKAWDKYYTPTARQRGIEPNSYLGVTSVPLPQMKYTSERGTTPLPVAPVQSYVDDSQDNFEESDKLLESYPAFGLVSGYSPLTEVHLRRLDCDDYVHTRTVAVINIQATAEQVWDVLTDYQALPSFVPNLVVSERLTLPPGMSSKLVRLRQVGYKRMLYMSLHAEAVIDLVEQGEREIQFRQVNGDFHLLQGKFMLQEMEGEAGKKSCETALRYAVEIRIPRNTPSLGLLEPLLERVVYEDVPANLAALKGEVERRKVQQRVEELEAAGDSARAAMYRRRMERPRTVVLMEDFNVLAVEMQRCWGDKRLMPTRTELRAMNRYDIEKAIAAHGGFAEVAAKLGWELKYKQKKPRGYWDSLDNVQREIDEFIEENDLESGVMPQKQSFIKSGRYDLARVVERWGGLYSLAGELGYDTTSKTGSTTEWHKHVRHVAAETGLSGKSGLFEVAAELYKSRRSMDEDAEELVYYKDTDDVPMPTSSFDSDQASSMTGLASSNKAKQQSQTVRIKVQAALLAGESTRSSGEGSGVRESSSSSDDDAKRDVVESEESGSSSRASGEQGRGAVARKSSPIFSRTAVVGNSAFGNGSMDRRRTAAERKGNSEKRNLKGSKSNASKLPLVREEIDEW